jgi:two-component system phosphate regulon sensor histidine kinase PhoR
MSFTPFNLRALIEEVVESLEPIAEAKEVRVLHRVPADLPPVKGDREQLRQVLVNLVDNAIKYNNPDGRIEVTARATGEGMVRVAVVDDGIGIPADEIPRLTERFYRVDRSRSRAQGGTGLGLAIVKHILEAHGQRLRVESRPDYGSSFSFMLPVGQRVEAPPNEKRAVSASTE